MDERAKAFLVAEEQRQAVLDSYGILDTLDESAYDDVTRLAAFICRTPKALVSFVDRDRQWFKARYRHETRQTPRTISFCAVAIQTPEKLLVVPDAALDPRFAGNPDVLREGGIRFYAGAPMVSPDGAALGTVCVIDSKPRALPARQAEALAILSRQVVGLLELRRGHAALEAANARLAALSLTDPLTCIPNRRAFMNRLTEEAGRARRSGEKLALLMADIDNFKAFNDSFGHPAGDEALYALAQLLSSGARPYDFVARQGGEEFAVILPRTSLEAALGVAERLRQAVAAAAGAHGRLTISVGAAALGEGVDAPELIRMADRALYEAKARGRNRVVAQQPSPAMANRAASAALLSTAAGPGTIKAMLEAVRKHLGMDVAYVNEFVEGRMVFREVDAPGFEHRISPGGSMALDDVYCRHILEGRLPQMVADTKDHPIARALPITESFPVGAHASVPITLADGSTYGMFCCLSTKPDLSLTGRDLQVMKVFADMAAHQIDVTLQQEQQLREARIRIERVIDRAEFRMVYQPILDLEPLRLVGFEALCRFSAEPYRPPDVWFNEAAGVGRGIELERAALKMALLAFNEVAGDLFISVNVSPEMILYEGFAQIFSNCPKRRLIVEITEHSKVEDYAAVLAALAPLRRDGVLVSIDDAGAGFASLKHILNLTPEIVKLDAGLTRALDTDPARRALAAALVYFARETRARIIAEGIETESELAALKNLGVPMGQGYLLGRPAELAPAMALCAGVG